MPGTFKLAPVKKTIYSLNPDLRELMAASNARHLEFLSALDDPSAGIKALDKISQPVKDGDRRWRGVNLFSAENQELCAAVVRGEFNISGMRSKDLRARLPDKSSQQISARLRRLRTHGLIRRVGRTYKYYLTDLGRRVVLAGLKLKELVVIPALAASPA